MRAVALERGAGAVGELRRRQALGRRHAAREGDRRHPEPDYDGRQIDDEARAGRLAALVAEVATVRPGVGARDREPEAGAGDAVARDAGPREPLEQRVLELVGDARAGVLDETLHRPLVDDMRGHAHRSAARSGTRS